jgi:mannose-6-phosphate isomerase-like protein (cupin superfamily)
MKKFKIKDFTKGWFIGDFSPSLRKTKDFEIAFKSYKAGEFEAAHLHKIATEFTLITQGDVSFNGKVYSKGEIVKVMPNEIVHFKSITDSETVVVKVPSEKNDKYTV